MRGEIMTDIVVAAAPTRYPSPQGGRRGLRSSSGVIARREATKRSGAATTALACAALLATAFAAYAVTPGEMLADPALEARARVITGELRCLVCQNQSVDDSDAPLAKDLRVLVREKLKEGLSDAAVKDYVHDRYGDFVLLRPPLKIGTILLWTAPLIALLAGGAAVWSAARRRGSAVAGAPALTEEERARLAALGVSADED
jgi:cytochrome c-type biogenesis protein CcmH